VTSTPRAASRLARIPFDPARLPFYYGWVMVPAAIIALVASIPGQTMGVSVFTDSLINAWGLTRTQLSTAYLAGTVVSSFALPLAGTLLDRFGSRAGVVFASVGLGLSLLIVAWGDYILALWPEGRPFAAAFLLASVAFLFTRFFGQGCLALVSRVIVGQWFETRRGRATALIGFVGTIFFGLAPRALEGLVAAVGWREAYLILAASIGLGVAGLCAVIFRDSPEQCGIPMEGGHRRLDAHGVPHPPAPAVWDFTRAEALRTRAFWVVSLSLSSQSLLVTAVTFHIASIGAEMGLTRAESFGIFIPMTFVAVAANLIGGWLSDRVPPRRVLLVFLVTQVIGNIGVLLLDTPIGVPLVCIGYGISGGLFHPLVTITWPAFFGRAHLGAISGFNMAVMVFASAIGPVLFSSVRDLTDSYRAILIAWCVVPFALALACRWARPPEPPTDK